MTNEELQQAIAWFENRLSSAIMPGAREMFGIALSDLREKLEHENPHPLTLDELREMGKTDWVWLTFPELPPEESGWYRAKQVYATYSHKHYGETWIAYRTKPKEDANG